MLSAPGTKRRFPTRVRSGGAGPGTAPRRVPAASAQRTGERPGSLPFRLPGGFGKRLPGEAALQRPPELPTGEETRTALAAEGRPGAPPGCRLCPPAPVSPGLHGSARRSREAPEGGSLVGCKLWCLSKAGTKVTSRSLKTFFYYFHSPFIKGQVSETQIIPPAQDSPAICQAGKICIANLSKCNLRESYSEYCFD